HFCFYSVTFLNNYFLLSFYTYINKGTAFGDNIKLSCISSDNVKIGARFSWYRQKLGMKPVLISSYFKYDQKDEFYGEFSRDKRFRLDYENDKHDLHINNVSMSDSAVYHCVKCYLHQIDFLESVTVIVKTLEPTIEVRQSAHEEIEPGHSVILNCSVQTESCEGPHRVHWFKQFVESAAGVLYSHGGGNMHDGCKNKGKSPTNFCVYNLPIHNVSSEQTGTYYCAVAACGQVLFGNGTQITIKEHTNSYIQTHTHTCTCLLLHHYNFFFFLFTYIFLAFNVFKQIFIIFGATLSNTGNALHFAKLTDTKLSVMAKGGD
uniref:Ig-like domain-containing protein n=1 Tax=Periophthalmus magnuspinnatus TaxID=409849 RepID=A0A3B3ZVN3_9GOBI